MQEWAAKHLALTSAESLGRFNRIKADPKLLTEPTELRKALLDFIADFANWDNSSNAHYIDTAVALSRASHATGTSTDSTRPLVVDPFAGGGAIPLEAARVGADVFASDLNPIPILLNKVLIEFIPKYGTQLASDLRRLAAAVRAKVQKDLASCYPPDTDGAVPIAYLWARTIRCEGPGCGAEVPLIRNAQLTSKGQRFCLEIKADGAEVRVTTREGTATVGGTVKNGSCTCPCCGYTTPAKAVKKQLYDKRGGSSNPRLLAVYVEHAGKRRFRSAIPEDARAVKSAIGKLNDEELPQEVINPTRPWKNTRGLSAVTRIGITRFSDLYTPRQALAIIALRQEVFAVASSIPNEEYRRAVVTVLHFVVSRYVFQNCALSRWHAKRSTIEGAFGKQALQVVWDFVEANPFSNGSGNWNNAVDWVAKVVEQNSCVTKGGLVQQLAAQDLSLPDDSAQLLFTDPPYFAAIPYADLSNVFYVWERDLLSQYFPEMYTPGLVEQSREIIVTNSNPGPNGEIKTPDFFEQEMARALGEGRRVVEPQGVGVVVFADSSPASWEAVLGAIVSSGWTVTSSWPLDTEMQTRTQAQESASLQSSVHIVCRPRETADGKLVENVGDWRTVLAELPKRIHEWMPRLAEEGVVGADAIFACIGPALEVFSRYSRVEKASGEVVTLREYLEQVWAAVSTEALSMIFQDADAAGLESDARFTAIVLWTLGAGGPSSSSESDEDDVEAAEDEDDDEDSPKGKAAKGGYTLEYDAARKIAQGLGVNLEQIDSVVEVKGDKARLRPVSERAATLFGKAEKAEAATKKRGKKATQKKLFDKDAEEGSGKAETVTLGDGAAATPGVTALDRVHQAMLLFAGGRADALKRFIVEDGVGGDARFWKLAQSLSALYPAGSDEKRWVDGVLARKKSFGF